MGAIDGLTIVVLIIILWAVNVSWTTFFVCICIAYFLFPVIRREIRNNYYQRV